MPTVVTGVQRAAPTLRTAMEMRYTSMVQVPENISKGDLARLVPVLHAQLPAILTEVREQFRGDWPEYAEFLDDEQDEVTTAARAFLTWLVELADHPPASSVEMAWDSAGVDVPAMTPAATMAGHADRRERMDGSPDCPKRPSDGSVGSLQYVVLLAPPVDR